MFSASGRSFIMYGLSGRSCVAMGDPVGQPSEAAELGWAFLERCDRNAWWPVFYEVRGENLPLYLDLGLTPLKIGEDARVSLPGFRLEGADWKGQRNVLSKLERDGCVLDLVPKEGVEAVLDELRAVSDAWLADKRTREKRFSLGRFDEDYLRLLPIAIVRRGSRIVAFANLWLSGDREEVSVDLMRHVADAPPGVMEWLFLKLMIWGRDEGYSWFDLGMAPLSGLPGRVLASRWSRIGSLLYRHGENFYNFQGLRQFKEKFKPQWRPIYLACPGGLALPRILANVGSLVSGGLTGVLKK
jgi:phosphatidylglycerol lysyltransferase